MSYVVRTADAVTRFLDRAGTNTRDSFLQIVELLSQDPYPSVEFPFIREEIDESGRPFFIYVDTLFPYAVVFQIYPLDATVGGLVHVTEIKLYEEYLNQG